VDAETRRSFMLVEEEKSSCVGFFLMRLLKEFIIYIFSSFLQSVLHLIF